MILKNDKPYKRHAGQWKRNLGPDLPILKSTQLKNSQMVGSNRKDRSLERKMDKTINSELNSQISGKNLSEFSIKFEGLSDTFSRNEAQDIDDGKNEKERTCRDTPSCTKLTNSKGFTRRRKCKGRSRPRTKFRKWCSRILGNNLKGR